MRGPSSNHNLNYQDTLSLQMNFVIIDSFFPKSDRRKLLGSGLLALENRGTANHLSFLFFGPDKTAVPENSSVGRILIGQQGCFGNPPVDTEEARRKREKLSSSNLLVLTSPEGNIPRIPGHFRHRI
ncbi:hypothetical protein L6164_024359 [Bauhinia variegata]|uniref:Uncharacterized protein n=1 Tax=Bauhinia variegata TaxID=167791 RepID=A0ACB9LY83_BAUVA|nr:hypothetical protein L6164_024359 [Bauhinia variegata]